MILSARVHLGMRAMGGLAAAHSPEQCVKEVAELRPGTIGRRAGKLEPCIPVGRRAELLALLPLVAQLIVGGALLRVAEHFVGLTDLLEPGLSRGVFVDVRVELAGELAIGPLDLLLRRIPLQTENLVVVFVLHDISHNDEASCPIVEPSDR